MTDTGGNLDAVRRIADAVLYEGYILYPYLGAITTPNCQRLRFFWDEARYGYRM